MAGETELWRTSRKKYGRGVGQAFSETLAGTSSVTGSAWASERKSCSKRTSNFEVLEWLKAKKRVSVQTDKKREFIQRDFKNEGRGVIRKLASYE